MASDATVEALLKAARAAFCDRGYAAVSVSEIANAANATTGAIYHHFQSKEGLLLAVAETIEQEILNSVRKTAPTSDDPWILLEHSIRHTLEYCSKRDISAIIFREAPTVLGIARWRKIELNYGLGGLEALLSQTSNRAELTPDDPELVSRILLGALIHAAEVAVDRGANTSNGSEAVLRVLNSFRIRRTI